MRRRWMALALTVCLAAALLPTDALAEEAPVAVRRSEARITLEVTGADGEVPARLQENGAMNLEGAEAALLKGLVAGDEKIYLYKYNIPLDYAAAKEDATRGHEELDALLHKVCYRYGQLFHFTGGCEFSVTGDGKYIQTVKPVYSMTGAEYTAAKAFYDKTLDDIVAQVPAACNTNELKALFIHDYLATHYAYDHSYQNYDAYSFFKDGKGVCQAYILAFSALMDKLDIPVSYVESDILNHAWNVVRLEENGPWYHVDVTWDDPTIVRTDGSDKVIGYADMPNGALHNYFLISDTRNGELRASYAATHGLTYKNDQVCGLDVFREETLTCADDSFEAFYKGVSSPIVYVEGSDSWYYVSSRCDTHKEGDKTLVDVDYRGIYTWDPKERTGEKLDKYTSGFINGICGLVEYEGSMFFSVTDGIYRCELAGAGAVEQLETSEDRVSGLSFDENGDLYYVKQDSQERVTVRGAKPWHNLGADDTVQYYYNFGAVALQIKDGATLTDHVFLAWYAPTTGAMTRLVAAQNGTFGVSGADKGMNVRAFRLSKDGKLTPQGQRFDIRSQGSE